MKKRCCSCNDLACCKNKLSFISDVTIQTIFSDKQDSSNKTITFIVIDTDPKFLRQKLKVIRGKPVRTDIDVVEDRVMLDEILWTKIKTRKQYNFLYQKFD